MASDYRTAADDFFVNMDLETTLALPTSRETVLLFCEAIQREFPEMTGFFQRDGDTYVLEGDREKDQYRWMELHPKRLSSGAFNPADLDEASHLHRWLLDRSTYFLGIGGLDVDCLNVTLGFNFNFVGNRDEIVAAALLGDSPLAAMSSQAGVRCLEFQPWVVVSLDEECYLQARLGLETRSSSYEVRTGQYNDEPISVYLTVRRYDRPGETVKPVEWLAQLTRTCDDLVDQIVRPNVLRPLAEAIAAAE